MEGPNFILRIKEQESRLTLQEHDDDDDELQMKSPNRMVNVENICSVITVKNTSE